LAIGHAPSTRLRVSSPDGVTKPAKLRLPRDEERTRHHVPLHDFALPLRLQFSPSWGGRFLLLGIGWLHLRKCLPLPRLDRDIGGRWRGRDAALTARDPWRNDRRQAGVENDPLRPFPFGMNADDGQISIFSLRDRRFREICIQNKQQREQHSANVEKIPRKKHSLLHLAPLGEYSYRMSATRLLTRSLRPKRGNETAVLAEVVGAADDNCTPRPLRVERARSCLGTISASSQPRAIRKAPNGAFAEREIQSASASAIHRAAAIHRRSCGTDAGGHRCARDRPRAQNNARSYGAANGIFDILAVYAGASPFRARGDEASRQERRYCDREFHFDLPGVGGSTCAPRANRSPPGGQSAAHLRGWRWTRRPD